MNDAPRAGNPRILIVKLSSLGDILHALPAVHGLRVGLGATVDWAVQSEYAGLVACFEDVTRVIPTSRRAFIRDLPTLLRALRAERYDLVIDLQGLLKSGIVTRLARGARRIGPSFHREGARAFYDEVAGPRNLRRHAVEQCRDVVRHLGLAPVDTAAPMRFPAMTVPDVGRHVALLPVSRWPSKNWPAQHFATLARSLHEIPDVTLHLLGGPADASVCAGIGAGLDRRRVILHAGNLALAKLGGFLQRMDLLIANDSGPVHLAAAVGTPCLVMFGPTNPERTGPYGDGHRVLRAPPPCVPCYDRRCRWFGVPCLEKLRPETVLQAAQEMLAAGRPKINSGFRGSWFP